MGLAEEGSVSFRISHADPGWATNAAGYDFGPIRQGELTVAASKRPDRTLELTVRGPYGESFLFHGPLGHVPPDGANVTITWKDAKVHLYIQGRLVQTAGLPTGQGGLPA